jgi:putative nucleotidyltransferase-like protein
MSQHTDLRVRALRPAARKWLVRLADPLARAPTPARPLQACDPSALLAAAELHGVLPAAIRAMAHVGADCTAAQPTNGLAGALATARANAALQAGFGLMLRHHGKRATKAFEAESIEGAVVKGAVAAERLYCDASLRTFTDIDVLVGAAHRARAADVMRGLGFELFTFGDRIGKDYEEDKWLLKGEPGAMVEVHTNLVHSPKLRASMSVGYPDVLEAGDGDCAAPTALLFVAAAHAAIGHQFDRLQQLVDIVQATRGAAGHIDVERLRRVCRRSGVLFAVVTAIELAGRTFGEPRCTDLARRLDPAYARCWRRLLVTPGVVVAAQTPERVLGSWRRKLYRQCLVFRPANID